MNNTEKILVAVLKSIIYISVSLIGIAFAAHQIYFLSIPLVVIGFLGCLFLYLNLDINIEGEKTNNKKDEDSKK